MGHPVAGDAGVVDQDVQLAERVDGGLHERVGGGGVGDRPQVHRRCAGRQRLAGSARIVGDRRLDVVDDHARAFAHEGERARAADAAARAGDDGNPLFEQSHVGSSDLAESILL
jgi:hypothetical protein